MTIDRLAGLGRAALPVAAILVFIGSVAATVASAGETLGYDFLAYHQAAVRLLDGQSLYDMGYQLVATEGTAKSHVSRGLRRLRPLAENRPGLREEDGTR